MKKVMSDIQSIDDKVKVLDMQEKQSMEEIRKCFHYNKGFCKRKNECPLYHPENTCKQFEKEGFCSRSICRDRHQKTCKYWKAGHCYRGESCQFSHRDTKHEFLNYCEKCKNPAINLYYCDFCGKSFCSECTVKEAHDKNYIVEEIKGCKQIHENEIKDNPELADELEMSTDEKDDEYQTNENINNDETCECDRKKEITFKCKDCGKSFCEECPKRPINKICIPCMMHE